MQHVKATWLMTLQLRQDRASAIADGLSRKKLGEAFVRWSGLEAPAAKAERVARPSARARDGPCPGSRAGDPRLAR